MMTRCAIIAAHAPWIALVPARNPLLVCPASSVRASRMDPVNMHGAHTPTPQR